VCAHPNTGIEGRVLARVIATLGPLGLPCLKISLRCRQEFDSLWKPPSNPGSMSTFLAFWMCVSLLEMLAQPPLDHQQCWRDYQTCKHILRLWRLAAIAESHPISSWADTASYMVLHLDSRSSSALLDAKLGLLDLQSNLVDLFELHEHALSQHLSKQFPGF
jgi:hypothetical protein